MSLTITLPDELARLVEEKIATGLYERAEDVIEAALHNLEPEPDLDPAELRRLWDEGIASGIAEDFSFDDLRRELRERFDPPKL